MTQNTEPVIYDPDKHGEIQFTFRTVVSVTVDLNEDEPTSVYVDDTNVPGWSWCDVATEVAPEDEYGRPIRFTAEQRAKLNEIWSDSMWPAWRFA